MNSTPKLRMNRKCRTGVHRKWKKQKSISIETIEKKSAKHRGRQPLIQTICARLQLKQKMEFSPQRGIWCTTHEQCGQPGTADAIANEKGNSRRRHKSNADWMGTYLHSTCSAGQRNAYSFHLRALCFATHLLWLKCVHFAFSFYVIFLLFSLERVSIVVGFRTSRQSPVWIERLQCL